LAEIYNYCRISPNMCLILGRVNEAHITFEGKNLRNYMIYKFNPIWIVTSLILSSDFVLVS